MTKGIQPAVKNAVITAANGSFKGGNYIGTLANGGVTLAPYHDFASKIPSGLKAEVIAIKQGSSAARSRYRRRPRRNRDGQA